MASTKRLYYDDSYLREFEAHVIDVEPQGAHFRICLDRTAFYPESGGQPMDRGTLGGLPVIQVTEEADAVVHVVERELPRDQVKGVIDWPRRFEHMQQHTGQHLLSAAFEKVAEARTVGFHLGADSSTIDLDTDRLGRRQMEQAEELANQVVLRTDPSTSSTPPPPKPTRWNCGSLPNGGAKSGWWRLKGLIAPLVAAPTSAEPEASV